jgi:phosphoglycerate dehydrogenase-like enzyme
MVVACLNEREQADFFPSGVFSKLRELCPGMKLLRPPGGDREEFHRMLAEAKPEVLIGGWSLPPLPATLPKGLRYLCYLCGSVRHIVARRHLEDGLLVTNWGDSISRTVAEAALLHILSCLRRAVYWEDAMHNRGAWRGANLEGQSLFGRRVGIHGFGRVSRELIRLLRPFGVTVRVFAPDADDSAGRTHGFETAPTLDDLFAESDIVVELAPLLPETTGVIQERHFRLLPAGGVFVNVGRGATVDEEGLVRVAREGAIQLGLDVFAEEPLRPDHPLRGLPNVFLTPHIAGPTADRCRDAGEFAVANLRRFSRGEAIEALITPDIYDRST